MGVPINSATSRYQWQRRSTLPQPSALPSFTSPLITVDDSASRAALDLGVRLSGCFQDYSRPDRPPAEYAERAR